MNIYYADFNKCIGYNCYNKSKPFYLLSDVIVIIEENKKKIYLKLPKGFQSDGCTIWKPFRLILGCQHTPEYVIGSIIHDYIINNPKTVKYKRNLSSRILLNCWIKEGVNPVKAYIMYLCVDFYQWARNFFVTRWI